MQPTAILKTHVHPAVDRLNYALIYFKQQMQR